MEVSKAPLFYLNLRYADWELHRWLFIIEGAGTMVAGIFAVLLLPDFPESGQRKWLSEQEQRFAQWRLAQAANDEVDENGSIKQALVDAFTDPKAWILVAIQVCQLTSQTWTYFFPVSAINTFSWNHGALSNHYLKISPLSRPSASVPRSPFSSPSPSMFSDSLPPLETPSSLSTPTSVPF